MQVDANSVNVYKSTSIVLFWALRCCEVCSVSHIDHFADQDPGFGSGCLISSVLVTRDASMYIPVRFNAILDEGGSSKISNCLGRLRPV